MGRFIRKMGLSGLKLTMFWDEAVAGYVVKLPPEAMAKPATRDVRHVVGLTP